MQTKPHYILYFDVLGYKEIVQHEDENAFLLDIQKMYNEEILDKVKRKYSKCKIFSDNAIVTFPKIQDQNKNDMRLKQLCHFAARLQEQCLRKYGILIRGAISEGLLYMDDNFVYGSGLISVYELENSEAIYPRIIVDPNLYNNSYISSSTHTIFKEKIWDNYYFINFLNYYHPNINTNGTRKKHLEHIEKKIDDFIKNNSTKNSHNARVLQKFFWLRQLLNYLQKNGKCICNTKESFLENPAS